jgi:hypothetical protein
MVRPVKSRRLRRAAGADNTSALPATGNSARQPGNARCGSRIAPDSAISAAPRPKRQLLVLADAAKGAGERAASQQFPGTGERQVEGHNRGRADQRDIESNSC